MLLSLPIVLLSSMVFLLALSTLLSFPLSVVFLLALSTLLSFPLSVVFLLALSTLLTFPLSMVSLSVSTVLLLQLAFLNPRRSEFPNPDTACLGWCAMLLLRQRALLLEMKKRIWEIQVSLELT